MAWFPSDEANPEKWREVDNVRRGEETHSTYARAVAAQLPYDRRGELRGTDNLVQEISPEDTYEFVRARCYGTVDPNGRLKLNERGMIWGDEEHCRYRRITRRPGEPTETEPFEGYTVWTQEQYGEITREDDSVTFEGDDQPPTEDTTDQSWEECTPFQRLILAELELVRNPPYARACLQERDEWEEIDTTFRYLLHAFDTPP